jgi:hypothetical protein
MQATMRYCGGHRHGLNEPTVEQRAHAARVVELLARIFSKQAHAIAFPARGADTGRLAA